MIKCCIFDLDGTLLDTISTITHYVNRTLLKYGLTPLSEDECKKIVGDGAALLIERAFHLCGVYNKDIINEALLYYKPDYDSDPLYLTVPFDGISEMLSALKRSGIRLAVLSNKPNTAVLEIINHFFPNVFDSISGGKDGIPLKPDPAASIAIARELGISPSECAFIGDTGVDMKTGVNMGAALKIGVPWGFRSREDIAAGGADVIAETPDMVAKEVLSHA